jgi:hypothetical protein
MHNSVIYCLLSRLCYAMLLAGDSSFYIVLFLYDEENTEEGRCSPQVSQNFDISQDSISRCVGRRIEGPGTSFPCGTLQVKYN